MSCFGKKPVQVGKFIFVVLIEFLKSKYKIYLKTPQFSIITGFLAFANSLTGLN